MPHSSFISSADSPSAGRNFGAKVMANSLDATIVAEDMAMERRTQEVAAYGGEWK